MFYFGGPAVSNEIRGFASRSHNRFAFFGNLVGRTSEKSMSVRWNPSKTCVESVESQIFRANVSERGSERAPRRSNNRRPPRVVRQMNDRFQFATAEPEIQRSNDPCCHSDPRGFPNHCRRIRHNRP